MSLINQMLKDLDARHSEVTGAPEYGNHIRAIPERRRRHAAWWAVLATGVVLLGVIAWLLLRPVPKPASSPTLAQQVPAQLLLKLDSEISGDQLSSLPGPIEKSSAVVISEVMPPVPAPKRIDDRQGSNPEAGVQMAAVNTPAPAAKPAMAGPAAKEPAAAPVADIAKVVAPPASKTPEPGPPIIVSKQIRELTPQQRAENEYRKAILSMQQGRAVEAIGGLEQALQLDPQHAAARMTLVGVFMENKRHDDAIRKAREGLGLDSAQPGLAIILARLQLEKGELRPAIETLQRTLPSAVERADYQSFLAALLQREGRNKEAAEHYMLALQRAPQNGVWWMGLGISLEADNRLAEAQESFGRAKATNGLSPELLAFVEGKLKQLQR